MPALFSYGTLQQREVQLANYGRELDGHSDTLAGYRLEQISIDDPQVVRLSGKSVHVIARQTGNADDQVAGTLFDLTDAELRATDDYEVAAYSRIEVRLESGRSAWVYVAA
jgi:gamma-glutamylcyclotransferase (GGCT)/AIG2-like uncharacterized protein YtfP